jgi:hypothetical protein
MTQGPAISSRGESPPIERPSMVTVGAMELPDLGNYTKI